MGRLLLLLSLLPGCYDAHLRALDVGPLPDAPPPDAPPPVAASLVWALVHPSDAPMGPGLYLVDEPAGAILRYVPLADGVLSPNALTWDGSSLWMSDMGDVASPSILEIDPETGAVRSRIVGYASEGLAWDGTALWATTLTSITRIMRLDRTGEPLQSVVTEDPTIQDLVFARGSLFYLVNDDLDRIVRLDPETSATTELTRGVDVAPYAIGFDGIHVAAAMWGRIQRYDPETGTLVSTRSFPVPGWITGLAFVR